MSATSYRILAVHGDMFSCLSDDCPRFKDCWRAQKPEHSHRQSYAVPDPNGCEDFIAIKHIGQPIGTPAQTLASPAVGKTGEVM